MKFLVCIAKAPDTTSKISFVENNTKFNEDKITFIVNPYDEWYALVRALEIKEAQGGSVTVIHVGGADSEQIIRKALAIGADDAVRIDAAPDDASLIAENIALYAKDKGFDVIMAGKESIDHNGSSVGAMIAEYLDLPFVSLVTKLDMDGSTATMEREIEGGSEKISAPTPLVLSANKGMAEQRIASMRGIMAARTKVIEVLPAQATQALTEVVSFTLPAEKSACKMIPADNVQLLIDDLHNEAKVI